MAKALDAKSDRVKALEAQVQQLRPSAAAVPQEPAHRVQPAGVQASAAFGFEAVRSHAVAEPSWHAATASNDEPRLAAHANGSSDSWLTTEPRRPRLVQEAAPGRSDAGAGACGSNGTDAHRSLQRPPPVQQSFADSPLRAASSGFQHLWSPSAQEAAETGRQSQDLLQEMRRLRLQMNELEKAAGVRPGVASEPVTAARHADPMGASFSSLGGESSRMGASFAAEKPRTTLREGCSFDVNDAEVALGMSHSSEQTWQAGLQSWSQPAAASHGHESVALGHGSTPFLAATRQDQGLLPEFAGWEYKAHASGDPVDAAVAALVNRPGGRYRGWRALLCRLDQGVYLCGTRRVRLRANLQQEIIEASEDGGATWTDLEDLSRGSEASQFSLLERARGAASIS